MDMYMVPIVGVHHKSPMNFSQDITDYSESGRKKIHSNQKAVSRSKLRAMQLAFDESESVEFRSNAVSRFVAQYGNQKAETVRMIIQISLLYQSS